MQMDTEQVKLTKAEAMIVSTLLHNGNESWLTIEDIHSKTGVSIPTIYRAIKKGVLVRSGEYDLTTFAPLYKVK